VLRETRLNICRLVVSLLIYSFMSTCNTTFGRLLPCAKRRSLIEHEGFSQKRGSPELALNDITFLQ